MIEKIFVNLNSGTIVSARVESASDPTPKAFSPLVVGDLRDFDLYFVDGVGGYETGGDVSRIELSIEAGSLLSKTSNFLSFGNAFRMSLSLASPEIENEIASGDIQAKIKITRTTKTGETRTILFAPVTLTGSVSEIIPAENQIFQECFIISLDSEDQATETGSARSTFRLPFTFEILEARASVKSAPEGSSILVDVNQNGSSIFTDQLEIPGGSKTSQDALVLPTFSTSTLADDSELSIDVDQIGSSSPGSGLKVYLSGRRG